MSARSVRARFARTALVLAVASLGACTSALPAVTGSGTASVTKDRPSSASETARSSTVPTRSGTPTATGAPVSSTAPAHTAPPSFPDTPDISWTEHYRETFEDADAASAWIWTGPHVPTIAGGYLTYVTQSGQTGYTGIGADRTHSGFGGGADDDSLRTIRLTATVELSGIDEYGFTCLDRFSQGGYPSPSMYGLVVSSSGARIWKLVDDTRTDIAAIEATGLPDPFTGTIRGTCVPVDDGYYLELALDDDIVLAALDSGPVPDGLNARLYEGAGPTEAPRVSIDEVLIEVPEA